MVDWSNPKAQKSMREFLHGETGPYGKATAVRKRRDTAKRVLSNLDTYIAQHSAGRLSTDDMVQILAKHIRVILSVLGTASQ